MQLNEYCQLVSTIVGDLLVSANEDFVIKLSWAKELPLGFMENANDVTKQAEKELKEYFNKQRKSFDIKVFFVEGTDFQKQVWQTLKEIPFGETVTYQDLAKKLDSSSRAVGGAVGSNPVPIIFPCHRVVGKGGILTGFSGGDGIATKKQLLDFEKTALKAE